MALPPRSFLTIHELAIRWDVASFNIASWALDGHFRLAIAMPPARADGKVLAGVMQIAPEDIFSLFRRDGSAPDMALIRRVRMPEEREWTWITEPAEGVIVRPADVLIPRPDFNKFEAQHGLVTGVCDGGQGKAAASKPGPPFRYDWDRFYIALCKRIHDEGLPPTQADLIREMQEWFGQSFGPEGQPDESMIRRKVQAVWRGLQ